MWALCHWSRSSVSLQLHQSKQFIFSCAHFCRLHFLGFVLQPSLVFSFSCLLKLELYCPLLLQSTNQKVWKLVFPHTKHNFCQIMSPSKPVVCLCRFLSKMADRERKTVIKKLHNLSLLCLYLVSALLMKGFSLEPTPFSLQMTLVLFQQ